MKLPIKARDIMIVSIDDYLETVNDDPGATELAEKFHEILLEAADESGIEEPSAVVTAIEEKAKLEEPLVDVLEYELGRTNELELAGEDIVEFIEKLGLLEFNESGEDEDEDLDDEDFDEDLDDE